MTKNGNESFFISDYDENKLKMKISSFFGEDSLLETSPMKDKYEILFHMEEKKGLRPYKIRDLKEAESFIEVKKLIARLRRAQNIFLDINIKNKLDAFEDFMKSFQIPYTYIYTCRLCINSGKISIIDENNYVKSFKDKICFDCALEELKSEMAFHNFTGSDTYLDNLKNILHKIRDTNKIIKYLFSSNYDVTRDKDLTIYDKIESDLPYKKDKLITHYNLSEEFTNVLKKSGFNAFLPVQELALEEGVLEGKDLLIVSSTSSGKTLIGELAGIPKILHDKKFKEKNRSLIFLNPLKAICNQQKDRFKKRYRSLNIKAGIKVGMSSLQDIGKENLLIIDDKLKDLDIITATYEAFDFVLRSGNHKEQIKEPSTVIIDEIQMLNDEDRGTLIDGLIARIKTLFPKVQLIFLSATISNANEIAKKMKMNPVIFNQRPVPIERHLILNRNEGDKIQRMAQLINNAYDKKSSFGFRGTTIIFTNSRMRTHYLAKKLMKSGINAIYYHAGLSYYERKRAEENFEAGKHQAIVTTYALGAGFDAPAYQVIFETLYMGREELSPNMFHQMLGRAGRYKMHDEGRVVILIEMGRSFIRSKTTEEELAIKLLESSPEKLEVSENPDQVQIQILCALSSGLKTIDEIQKFYDELLYAEEELKSIIKDLTRNKWIERKEEVLAITKLGKAVALSFFDSDEAKLIMKELKKGDDPLEIAIKTEYFENIYVSDKIQDELNRALKTNIPTKFLTGFFIDLTQSLKKLKKRKINLPPFLTQAIIRWQKQFFNCSCEDRFSCDCAFLTLNREILELRMTGLTPKSIGKHFEREYNLVIFTGDLFAYLDNILHTLVGIKRIADALNLKDTEQLLDEFIRKIEKPK